MVTTEAVRKDSPVQERPGPDFLANQLADVLYGVNRGTSHKIWQRCAADQWTHSSRYLYNTDERNEAYRELRNLKFYVDTHSLAGDACQVADLHEWLAPSPATSLAIIAGIHFNLFLGSLLDHDRSGHELEKYLSLEKVGTFLVTELAHGNDVNSLETTATYVPSRSGFVLHTPTPGACKFMPNTGVAGGPKDAVVAARLIIDGTDEGIFLFLVPLSDGNSYLPDVHATRLPSRIGADVDHCLTRFDNVFIPRTAMLAGAQGRISPEGNLASSVAKKSARVLYSINRVNPGKLAMSASSLGMAKHALVIATRYSGHRYIGRTDTGGAVPLMALESHNRELVGSMADIFVLTSLHRNLQRQWNERASADTERLEWLLAVAKASITWRCREIVTECRERCGAQGLFPVNAIGRYLSLSELTITAEGDNMAVWVKAAAQMVRRHPCAPDPEKPVIVDLSSPDYLQYCLAEIENFWLEEARQRRSQCADATLLERQNSIGVPARRALRAAARRIAAETFIQQLSGFAVGTPVRELLEDLYRLFVLRGLVDMYTTRACIGHTIEEMQLYVEGLIAQLVGKMDTLVAAFEIPEEALAEIPIANDDYLERL